MFEFGSISRAKCSRGSMFDLPMFEVFEVRFFDVRSKTSDNIGVEYFEVCACLDPEVAGRKYQ